MDLSNIELDTELIHKLSSIPEGAEDVDYEALGIDITGLQAQIQALIENGIEEQIMAQADLFNKIELFIHPFFLTYFAIIAVTIFFSIRAKSHWPSVLYIIFGLIAILSGDFLNEIVRDTLGESTWVFESNPFDNDGLFFAMGFLQPIVYAMIILSLRLILASISLIWCGMQKNDDATATTTTTKNQKAKKD